MTLEHLIKLTERLRYLKEQVEDFYQQTSVEEWKLISKMEQGRVFNTYSKYTGEHASSILEELKKMEVTEVKGEKDG